MKLSLAMLALAAISSLEPHSETTRQTAAVSAAERISEQQEALKAFDWMDGEWRGDAYITTGAGKQKLTQSERVGPMLNGTIKVIEGQGTAADGTVIFNALALISYDPETKKFTWRSYALGHAGSFPVVAASSVQYSWEASAGPRATMRYTARREGDEWIEEGELVTDGRAPQRMIEMKLRRIGDTNWPSAR